MNIKKIITSAVMAFTVAAASGSAFAATVTNATDKSGCRISHSKLCFAQHRMHMEKGTDGLTNVQRSSNKAALRVQESGSKTEVGGVDNVQRVSGASPRVQGGIL